MNITVKISKELLDRNEDLQITIQAESLPHITVDQKPLTKEEAKTLSTERVHTNELEEAAGNHRSPWSEEDLQYLTDHYGVDSVTEISIHLGRSSATIYARAATMGLKARKQTEPTQLRPTVIEKEVFQKRGPIEVIELDDKSNKWLSAAKKR